MNENIGEMLTFALQFIESSYFKKTIRMLKVLHHTNNHQVIFSIGPSDNLPARFTQGINEHKKYH